MIAAQIDPPWSPARNRTSLLITLAIVGVVTGAIHAFLLVLGKEPGGDSLHWEQIEAGAELGVVPGLAAGLAVILSRSLWYRVAAAAIFATILHTLMALLNGAPLLPFAPRDWEDALAHPIGPALLLMAPTSASLALSVHLFRTCARTFREMSIAWVISVVLGIHSQSLYWFAVRATYLKNPLDGDAFMELLTPGAMGGLVFNMGAGIATLSLELASLHWNQERSARRITPATGAIAVLIVAGLHWLSQAMPWTPASSIEALAFGPDGQTIVTAHGGHTLRFWRIQEKDREAAPFAREIRKVRMPRQARERLSFATNGRQILLTRRTGRISLWDVATLDLFAEANYPDSQFGISALSPEGTAMAVFDHRSMTIWLWQGDVSARPFGTNPLILSNDESPVTWLGFTPDGLFLVSMEYSGRVLLWDRSSGKLLLEHDYPHGYGHPTMAISPDGHLLVGGAHSGWTDPEFISTEDGGRSFKLQSVQALSMAVSPDGRQFGRTDGDLLLISDLNAGETVRRTALLRAIETLQVIAYSPDGQLIATGSSGGRVQLFRAPIFDAD